MPFLHFPFLLHALRQGIRDGSDIGLICQYISGYPTLSETKTLEIVLSDKLASLLRDSNGLSLKQFKPLKTINQVICNNAFPLCQVNYMCDDRFLNLSYY